MTRTPPTPPTPQRATPALLALVTLIALSAPPSGSADAQDARSAETLLQEGYYREITLSDPRGALPIYERVIRDAPTPRVEAIARARRGVCLHVQGRLEEAEKEFQTILERLSSETGAVRIASRYLNVDARRNPARFMSPDTLAYIEIVDPEQQVEFLTDLLRGTPLENPVDYYLARSAADEAAGNAPSQPSSPRSSDLRGLRAILNLGFLKELQKIEGFAIGIADFDDNSLDHVGVLLPGTSDLTRGFVKAFVTVALEKVEENVEGMTVFSMRDRRRGRDDPSFFVAMGPNEEIVFFGTSLDLVRGAVLRSISHEASMSLADVPDFRRSLSARAGSSLFAYVNPRAAIERTASIAPDPEARDLRALVSILGLDSLNATSVTFSRFGDAFRYALRGRFAEEEPAWRAFRTPVLEPECLDLVPARPLGFAAFSIDEVDARLRELGGALRGIGAVSWLPVDVLELLSPANEPATSPPLARRARAVLEKLRGVAIVQPYFPSRPERIGESSWYLVLSFESSPVVDRDFDELVRFGFTTVFRNRASGELRDALEPLAFDGVETRLRLVEPSPGLVSGFARVPSEAGSTRRIFVLAPRAETLRTLFHRDSTEPLGFARDAVPVATSKFVYLAPTLLSPSVSGLRDPRDPLSTIVASLPQITLHTRESSRGLSVELRIPDAAPVLRTLLRRLPTQAAPAAEPGAGD